ncbi:MAG: peptidase E [Phenylobacterium sp.]|uniref:Type 1 glutamine amidotransferase-like domain-containing protein n=1 Tax=Phenylobacterium sp. TaxID=1871053 RepID=UPI0025CD421D|nr:Type 1 glutamine amidotransferase-like domain-containing protein [Phenylobacterium sp.]MBA4010637.1 peptidase E [Phenylobacterium sp.]
MRLYLSSYRFGNARGRLVDLAGRGARVAVVSNALDLIPDESRRAYARNVHDPLADLADDGFDPFELDLRDHFGDPAGLARALGGVGLVWAVGGNSFLLRRAMAQSGLDRILAERLARDDIAYGGWSAGACVAGASLRGIDLMDEPDAIAEGYDPAPIYVGLGLVDFVIVPHFASEHPEADAAKVSAAWLADQGIAHRTLRDGEAIVRAGDEVELVGDG